ncbi:MAG: glycosyltransferase family 2 protein [Planctomycetota bacterium]|nr:MAG: glycosyltransferase family 2 protein [Planctomycetota bacterium]
MSALAPVSIAMPCLDDRDLLARNLPPLLAELEARAAGDEVLVVDDTGEGVLAPWVAEHFPSVQVVARPFNGGFAQALLSGVRVAAHELVFCMNPDVRVHRGFLAPLVDCLADPLVHSACPRVLLNGDLDKVESVTRIAWRDDVLRFEQPGLGGGAAAYQDGRREVAFAVGGTCLLRRSEFLAAGGFDPLYEPFYMEDADLGLVARRAGRRVLYEPRSVVEHHHRGTIGKRIPRELVVAVIERNRLLLQWKLVDAPARARAHYAALHRVATDALLCDEREQLVWLALALARLEALAQARRALPPAQRGLDELAPPPASD